MSSCSALAAAVDADNMVDYRTSRGYSAVVVQTAAAVCWWHSVACCSFWMLCPGRRCWYHDSHLESSILPIDYMQRLKETENGKREKRGNNYFSMQQMSRNHKSTINI